MGEPNWTLSEDRKTMIVTFPTEPPVALRLDANAVDSLLQMVRQGRALMDAPRGDYELGQKVTAQVDPTWKTEPDLLRGDTLLHIRDDGYGWLHYLLPSSEATKLANYLLAQADLKTASLNLPKN